MKTKILSFLISLLITSAPSAIAQELEDPLDSNCPKVFPEQKTDQFQSYKDTLNEDKSTNNGATALVGVDALGRIAIAVDYEPDGYADAAMLLTSSARLDGPWSRLLTDATIKIKNGSVQITSMAEKYAMSLAVKLAAQPAVPGWAQEITVQSDMLEFESSSYGDRETPFASISHEDVLSWPDHFSYDSLDPGNITCTNEWGLIAL